MPVSLDNYRKVFVSPYIWNNFLSSAALDQSIFNFRGISYVVARLTGLNVTQLILLSKLTMMMFGALGIYKCLNGLNRRYLDGQMLKSAMILASIIYILNPSYLVGDNFWLGIQVGYYTLPFVVYFASKVLLGRELLQSASLLFIMFAINNAAHFVFGGYQIIILCVGILLACLDRELLNKPRLIFARVAIIAVAFLLGDASYLAGTLTAAPDLATTMTKQAIDVPWSTATFTSMASGMSYTQLFHDFYATGSIICDSIVKMLLAFTPFMTLLYLLRLTSKQSKNVNRHERLIFLFGIATFMALLLIFAADSPFEPFRFSLIANIPLGRIFRTWRIPEALIALDTAILVGLAINRLAKIRPILVYAFTGCAIAAFSYPVMLNHINGPLIKMPSTYVALDRYLSGLKDQSHSIIYSPAFSASFGVSASLKPYWSKYIGMIMEFAAYSSPLRSIVPQNATKSFYLYTSSEFYKLNGLLVNSNFYSLAHFYALDDVSYLLLHEDMPTAYSTRGILQGIQQSQWWHEVKQFGALNLFKSGLQSASVRIANQENIVVVNGGYRALARFYDELPQTSSTNTEYLYIDQPLTLNQLMASKFLLTDKSSDQNALDATYSVLTSNMPKAKSSPSKCTSDYAPEDKWSTATMASNHQQEWQPYINEMSDYAWDFDEGGGFLITKKTGSKINCSFSRPIKAGDTVMIRYLANDAGGAISLSMGSQKIAISTKQTYNGMLWYKFTAEADAATYSLDNSDGFNVVNEIVSAPNDQFVQSYETAANAIKSMTMIDVHIPYETNMVTNGDFRAATILKDWQFTKGSKGIEASIRDESGLPVLAVENQLEGQWSWIGSNWISVEPSRSYELMTNMKTENVTNSHIALIGREMGTGREVQLAQVPYATSGDTSWQAYHTQLRIPANISQIQVMLNAGWKQDNLLSAQTYFRQIQLVPLDGARNDFNLDVKNAALIDTKLINPAEKVLQIEKASSTDLIATTDSFDTNWQAYLVDKMPSGGFFSWFAIPPKGAIHLSSNTHVQVNGFNNGWLLDDDIKKKLPHRYYAVLIYKPQTLFATGMAATGITLCAVCIFWCGIGYTKYQTRCVKKK